MGTKKADVLLASSVVMFVAWMFIIYNAKSSFLRMANINPLAMIDALFPHFWLVLSIYCGFFLILFFSREKRRLAHVILLVQFALILHFTPFAMSGLTWNPDNLWLSSVAKYVPQVLIGEEVMLSIYAGTFPGSFILTQFITEVTGLDIFLFTRIYPIFSIVALTLIGYILTSKFVGQRVAFFSTFLVLLGWHYVDFHACPHMTGLLLLLTAMILLTHNKRKSVAVAFLVILALVLSHPISPLNLGIFLSVAYVCIYLIRRVIGKETESMRWVWSKKVLILFLGSAWITWLFYAVFPLNRSIEYALRRILTLRFSMSFIKRATEFSLGGGSFFYQWIFDLTRLTYVSYLIIAGILVLYDIFIFKLFRERVNDLLLKKTVLIISSICFVGFSYFLLLGTGDHHLLYRGQIPFILMISAYVASYFLITKRKNVKWRSYVVKLLFSFWVFFLAVSFPIVSYSIGAYNSFPQSEGIGMQFIAEKTLLFGKTVSMTTEQQITPYLDLLNNETVFQRVDFPPNLNKTMPDIVILKRSSFYTLALRYDLNLTNNRFIVLKDQLDSAIEYDIIYSNPTVEAYVFIPRDR